MWKFKPFPEVETTATMSVANGSNNNNNNNNGGNNTTSSGPAGLPKLKEILRRQKPDSEVRIGCEFSDPPGPHVAL